MAFERPTFSELWHRVANIRPRLRTVVRIYRQFFRGQRWYVVQDLSNNQFFRLHPTAYDFIARLDGKKSVADVWQVCMEHCGDDALTQGETIQLLARLYGSNLLQADVPHDAAALFRQYGLRTRKELRQTFLNFLFFRIPLIDPDRFLDRWAGFLGMAFSRTGFFVWLILMASGIWHLIGRGSQLTDPASSILNPENLPFLYLGFILLKVFHEMGHAVACKKFGRMEGGSGEVHVMGVLMLVLVPFPYVDASSAWALRKKEHRIIIGAAGVLVELALACIAAVVWTRTGQGTAVHAISYNMMIVASISTVLFNGNPLLRYDAYYVLSDLLEIPNLSQRSKDFFFFLSKRYLFGLTGQKSPVETASEKTWLIFYFIASTFWRILVFSAIAFLIAGKFFFIGAGLAVFAVIGWVGVPLFKFLDYLFTGQELAAVRTRAVLCVGAALLFFSIIAGSISFPDRYRIDGVIEPLDMAAVFASTDGFITDFLPSETRVEKNGTALIRAHNPSHHTRLYELSEEKKDLTVQKKLAMQKRETALMQILTDRIAAVEKQIGHAEKEKNFLVSFAPFSGIWVSPDIEHFMGKYITRGEKIGIVINPKKLIIRATAGQYVAATLIAEATQMVDIRVKGRPDIRFSGIIEKILPAGRTELPSKALGYPSGGNIETNMEDPEGVKTAERIFEIIIVPEKRFRSLPAMPQILIGQRVVVRFEMQPKPLAVKFWLSIRRLFQQRFHI